MNELSALPYLESIAAERSLPFERYLPPASNGILTTWISQHVKQGAWILEPIGASPSSILEIAGTNCKVLTAINNPVMAFELSILARAPSVDEFRSVLAELAMQKKGDERLETHIQNLYLTRCASCGKEISASAYLWRRSEPYPYARIYTCHVCHDSGEHPVTDEDVKRLSMVLRSDGLHRARALERVPEGTKEARAHLEDILTLYAPRPLYALFTLINKVEGMSLSPARRELLDALLLSALDDGHTLWPVKEEEDRQRVLNTPAEYIEKNIWMSLEDSLRQWTSRETATPLTFWPEVPDAAGICLYPGRMRDLIQQKPDIQPESMVCSVPRPNQAIWTLSALWSSWLWGKANAASLKNVFERQRFDWYWHANALQSAFAPAARMLKTDSKFFCLVTEPTTGFISSTVEACSASGYSLTGYAMKSDSDPIQLEWDVKPVSQEIRKVNLQKIIRESIHDLLTEIGEPCSYLKLFTAAIIGLAQENAFPRTVQQLTYETVGEIQNEINKHFSDRKALRRLDATAQDLESGVWWLTADENCKTALSDRVEMELVNWLQKAKTLPASTIRRQMNQRFGGYLTPPEELLDFCLHSYADYDKQNCAWQLKTNEVSEKRRMDMAEVQAILTQLAEKFNLESSGENPMLWFHKAQPGQPAYKVCLSASALISRFTQDRTSEPVQTVFIFPGSRSALLRYKLDHDANLRERAAENWHFLKFRTLRQMAGRKDISLDLWDIFIDSDPVSLEEATQLSMFL